MEIRPASEQDDDLFAQRYLDDWATENWPAEQYYPDAAERVRQFIQEKRAHDDLGGFVAMDGDEVAGIIGYHLDFAPILGSFSPSIFCLRTSGTNGSTRLVVARVSVAF
jgi:hypothetical protein